MNYVLLAWSNKKHLGRFQLFQFAIYCCNEEVGLVLESKNQLQDLLLAVHASNRVWFVFLRFY